MKIDSFFGKYRFLSNFWPCEIEYEGIIYPSTEHAFQAAKTLDEKKRLEIARLDGLPAIAKKVGKTLELRDDWEQIKISVMEDLLRKKFCHQELREQLLLTGDSELIEGNYWNDKFWGVCNGEGQNWLGKLLMKVRKEINGNP